MTATYDAIVVGTGGVGSAALHYLAKRGLSVLGIERFTAAHDRGSSHGHTRVIRQAYFEHPDYVPLLLRAFELWNEIEQEVERKLFARVGLLEVGPPDGIVIQGVETSARQHDLRVTRFGRDEAEREFPSHRIPEGSVAIFEQEAGYLFVEECVRSQLELARRHRAELRFDEAVTQWTSTQEGFLLRTDRSTYECQHLVITAGAWATELMADLSLPLRVLRKHLHWFPSSSSATSARGNQPTFFYERPGGFFYGFPALDERGVKVAEHSGGEPVGDPLQCDRRADPRDLARVTQFAQKYLPDVSDHAVDHAVCMYTMSTDEHFIVDRHPAMPRLTFVAGVIWPRV